MKCIVEYSGEIHHGDGELTISGATRVLTVEKELNRFQGLISAAEEYVKVTCAEGRRGTRFASAYENLKKAIDNAKE